MGTAFLKQVFLKLFWTRLAMIEWKRKKDGHKNAPASECRTYTQLVSLAFGRKKKKWNPLILSKIRHLELTYTLYNGTEKIISHWLISKIPKYHLNKGNFLVMLEYCQSQSSPSNVNSSLWCRDIVVWAGMCKHIPPSHRIAILPIGEFWRQFESNWMY